MDLTRRAFGASLLAASAGAFARPRMARAASAIELIATKATAQLAPTDYPATRVWAYDGHLPGPEIRLAQGTRLTRDFVNGLDQDGTVHWHGIRIDNAMDGVPGMTQDAVPPGGRFRYDFALPDAGTYWYHPHARSWEQMARGLSGALIIEEPQAPDVDADRVLVLDDWRLNDDAQIAEDFGAMHDWAHGGRIGNWITVNGDGGFTQVLPQASRQRLRLINAANARIFDLSLKGMAGWVAALDGMPLGDPQPVDRLALAPAQRADLIVDITAETGGEAFLVSHERDGGYAIAAFPVEAAQREARTSPPAPLPPNPVAPLGPLDTARKVNLTMEGGAMGGLSGAELNGERHDMRALVGAGKVWAFNGRADMPDDPLIRASAGETVRLEMVNDTAWAHAMHLHGHHFRRIGPDDRPGPLRDTLLMQRGERAEIAFVADNPGDWLLHCHMLEHAAAGMRTWLQVV